MATLVLTTVGTMLGGPIGGLLGTLVGQGIDAQILGGGPRKGPRLGDLSVQTSSYGSAIPRIYGTMRVAGTVVWATDLQESSDLQGDGKSQPETVAYSYTASFAVALSSRRAASIKRIWADSKLLRGEAGDFKVPVTFRFLDGSDDQAVDPLIASLEGVGRAPAYRGLALAVFEELALAELGNRIPSITFELEADPGGAELGALLDDASAGAILADDERVVSGYAAHGASIGDALAPLVETFAVELHDRDGALRTPTGGLRTVDEDELGAGRAPGGAARIERSQLAANSLPSALTLTYYDPARDYQAGQARASLPAMSRVARHLTVPIVLQAADAKGLAETQIARAWATRDRLTLRLPPAWIDLAPGQLLRLPGVDGDWLVDRVEIERFVVVATLRPAWKSAGARPADPGRGLPQPDVVAEPTRLALFDLPEPEGTQPTLHLAAASPSGRWRPVPIEIEVYRSVSAGLSAAVEAVLGKALTVLPSGQSFLIDESVAVEVELANADHWLQSRDEAALMAGANLAVIGDELLQFGRVEPLGPGLFRLSRLLRGRRGTEWAMAGHTAGEAFAAIDARALKPIAVAAEALGATVTVSAHGPGDTASPPSVARAANGEALRPLSPAHLAAVRNGDGSLSIIWVRRSRQGFAWLDEVDVPPDPRTHGYRVIVTGGGATVERDTAVEDLTIGAGEAGPLGAGPITISVRQIGDLALSRAAAITLSQEITQ